MSAANIFHLGRLWMCECSSMNTTKATIRAQLRPWSPLIALDQPHWYPDKLRQYMAGHVIFAWRGQVLIPFQVECEWGMLYPLGILLYSWYSLTNTRCFLRVQRVRLWRWTGSELSPPIQLGDSQRWQKCSVCPWLRVEILVSNTKYSGQV